MKKIKLVKKSDPKNAKSEHLKNVQGILCKPQLEFLYISLGSFGREKYF